ncbi:MAG: S-methyl-5'-thioinosine phosphorylase [Pseudohongiellaceae bacterium]
MLAIIGGTGLTELPGFKEEHTEGVQTPWARERVLIATGTLEGQRISFVPRHGEGHTVPPHRINYRAIIDALQQLEVGGVIAVNAVGGIHEKLGPGGLCIPDQIIDYSWGREHTFHNGDKESVAHVDFTRPYDEGMRQRLLRAADECGLDTLGHGVYGCTQGPRLETAAEVRRLQRDGCDMIGMTGMPEAALAREAGLAYACIALSVNRAAGLSDEEITMEGIRAVLSSGMERVHRILCSAVR